MDQPIKVLCILIPLLILVAGLSYWAATHGRKMTMPEEVTKGIKSEIPFPSPKSSMHSYSKPDKYHQISNTNSSIVNINENNGLPSEFDINDSTYVVIQEFVPKSIDELPIKKNQIISVKEIYEDGWCMAISVATGEMGVVPFQCLSKYALLMKIKEQKLKQMQQEKQHSQVSQVENNTTPQIIIDKNDK